MPTTEKQGRIQTSTAAILILPEAKEADVDIKKEDLKIDTMRASGAGGQHVNTTDSAVRSAVRIKILIIVFAMI